MSEWKNIRPTVRFVLFSKKKKNKINEPVILESYIDDCVAGKTKTIYRRKEISGSHFLCLCFQDSNGSSSMIGLWTLLYYSVHVFFFSARPFRSRVFIYLFILYITGFFIFLPFLALFCCFASPSTLRAAMCTFHVYFFFFVANNRPTLITCCPLQHY